MSTRKLPRRLPILMRWVKIVLRINLFPRKKRKIRNYRSSCSWKRSEQRRSANSISACRLSIDWSSSRWIGNLRWRMPKRRRKKVLIWRNREKSRESKRSRPSELRKNAWMRCTRNRIAGLLKKLSRLGKPIDSLSKHDWMKQIVSPLRSNALSMRDWRRSSRKRKLSESQRPWKKRDSKISERHKRKPKRNRKDSLQPKPMRRIKSARKKS